MANPKKFQLCLLYEYIKVFSISKFSISMLYSSHTSEADFLCLYIFFLRSSTHKQNNDIWLPWVRMLKIILKSETVNLVFLFIDSLSKVLDLDIYYQEISSTDSSSKDSSTTTRRKRYPIERRTSILRATER